MKQHECEQLWLRSEIYNEKGVFDSLWDDQWIEYREWKQENLAAMYKKYKPDTLAIIGKNPNVIFHGGCLGCISQRHYGIDRCKGCRYFRYDWNKPDLSIEGEVCDRISAEDIKKIINGKI